MTISSNFCYPQLHINGLRTPNVIMDRDGMVHFGCVTVHIDDINTVTDAEIQSCAGAEAVTWWTEWKGVLIPLFQKMYTVMDDYWANTPEAQIRTDVIQTRNEQPFLFQVFDPIQLIPEHQMARGAKKPKTILSAQDQQ